MGQMAYAQMAPHVAEQVDTDSCAMCHRSHSSASSVGYATPSNDPSVNALIVGTHPSTTGDTMLCYSCHGVEGVGATKIVQDAFESGSGHKLSPATSAYGPEHKQCSDCHDSHGTDKVTTDTPYPALLRTKDASGTFVLRGNDYCAACHPNRPLDTWDGLGIFNQTAHASIEVSSGGTQIVCSACHEPHGSPNAPTIRTTLVPPAVGSDTTITANDRQLCIACHNASSSTWPGGSTYENSSHGASTSSITALGEWASAGVSRRVGECQNCHAPMGSIDSQGQLVPKLLEREGRGPCERCHDSNGPAATDLESLAYTGAGAVQEITVGYGAGADTSVYGALDVFSRDSTSSPIVRGPRRFANHRSADVAAGDMDGDQVNELVSLRPSSTTVTMLGDSKVFGLTPDPGDANLSMAADFIAIGDVLTDVANAPELVAASDSESFVRVYQWNMSAFVPVATVETSGTATGLAVGDVNNGVGSDIVVTLAGTPGAFQVIPGGTSLTAAAPFAVSNGTKSPFLTDVDADGRDEIIVANSGDTSVNASVVEPDGTVLASVGTSTDASATAAAIGDILPNVSGAEMAIAYSAPDGTSRISVFPRSGGGFGAAMETTLPAHTSPSSLDVGDVDGDGTDELVAGLAGTFSRTGAGGSPGMAILEAAASGSTVAAPDLRYGGGVEAAGSASVLIADVGAVGPTRHPVGAVTGAHNSTETATLTTHVECVDCHNTHRADDTTATAPGVKGPLKGAWGVSVSASGSSFTLQEKQGVQYEYEVCLKCHSTWSQLGSVRSIASEVTTVNASFHPIEGPAPSTNASGTLVSGLNVGDQVYCTDCHGNAGAGAKGPHRSPEAPLLVAPYTGARPVQADLLCYSCHRSDVYATGVADGVSGIFSGFRDTTAGSLHSAHTARGYACASCHVSHGSANLPSLLRGDLGWSAQSGGGTCTTSCHSASRSYTRP